MRQEMQNLYGAQTFFRISSRTWPVPATAGRHGEAAIDEDTAMMAAFRHLRLVIIVLAFFYCLCLFVFFVPFLFSIVVLSPLLFRLLLYHCCVSVYTAIIDLARYCARLYNVH